MTWITTKATDPEELKLNTWFLVSTTTNPKNLYITEDEICIVIKYCQETTMNESLNQFNAWTIASTPESHSNHLVNYESVKGIEVASSAVESNGLQFLIHPTFRKMQVNLLRTSEHTTRVLNKIKDEGLVPTGELVRAAIRSAIEEKISRKYYKKDRIENILSEAGSK